jgi:hypothetical protein
MPKATPAYTTSRRHLLVGIAAASIVIVTGAAFAADPIFATIGKAVTNAHAITTFQTEFPDFPVADMPTIPEGLEDTSWRNDAMGLSRRHRWG